MKRYYIVTIIMLLLFVLFYSYGLSVERNESPMNPAVAAEADINLN